ncbi:MAG: hypothetical protein IPL61_04970 [Myxococcales bacterium]|nr:hypothetical protein [Myxococcales bacterium]
MRACLGIAVAATGCLYLEPINERPSAEIKRIGDGLVYRGDELSFVAVIDDPDHDPVDLQWRGQACDRPVADPAHRCSAVETGTDLGFDFTVPVVVDGAPATLLIITLEVTDVHGAVASPRQTLELPIANHPPTLALQRRGRELMGEFPVGVPITVSARATDVDTDAVALTWTLFPATTSRPEDLVFDRLPDPPSGGEEYRLVPDVAGDYLVRVVGDDGTDTAQAEVTIAVRPDHAPCLGAVEPATAAGAVVIALAPRRFAVVVVADDLDVYPPPPPDDPFLGAAELAWSMRPVGAPGFTAIGDGAAVDFDPATFAPGDRIELRVEVADRTHRWPAQAPACAVDAAACSVEPPASCTQRRTWLVEAR